STPPRARPSPEPSRHDPPPAASPPKPALALAPMPLRAPRLATPPLSPAVAKGEVSELSSVARRPRTRKALLVTLMLAFLALAAAGSVLLLSPHTVGRAG